MLWEIYKYYVHCATELKWHNSLLQSTRPSINSFYIPSFSHERNILNISLLFPLLLQLHFYINTFVSFSTSYILFKLTVSVWYQKHLISKRLRNQKEKYTAEKYNIMQERQWIVPHVKWTVVTHLSFLSLAVTFFINPRTSAFIFSVYPKMNSPKTLTIDKCLLNKTVSSTIRVLLELSTVVVSQTAFKFCLLDRCVFVCNVILPYN